MITELLRGAEYEVLGAPTLEQGRRLARDANPELIVVDVRLGPYNGLELAGHRASRSPHPAIDRHERPRRNRALFSRSPLTSSTSFV